MLSDRKLIASAPQMHNIFAVAEKEVLQPELCVFKQGSNVRCVFSKYSPLAHIGRFPTPLLASERC